MSSLNTSANSPAETIPEPRVPKQYDQLPPLSPVTILHELFIGENQPKITYKIIFTGNALNFECTVDVPGYGAGYGLSYSKKTAKAQAAEELLGKLNLKYPDLTVLKHTSQTMFRNIKRNRIELVTDPLGELLPKWYRVYSDARAAAPRFEHTGIKGNDPFGYIIMLCSKVCSDRPSVEFDYNTSTAMFECTVQLGPWTAKDSAPTKKVAKLYASRKLLETIENYRSTSA